MQEGIIVHCSDSPQGRGDDASTIDRWHKDRGWSGIGYHYVILEDGTIQTGRDVNHAGAHCRGFNNWIGICLIGKKTFTDEQYLSLELLVRGLIVQYHIDPEDVRGHRDLDKHKTCPNFSVSVFKAERGIL